MSSQRRVRCSPLGQEERVATVVDEEIVGDTRGPWIRYTVEIDGHRFRVDDVEPL